MSAEQNRALTLARAGAGFKLEGYLMRSASQPLMKGASQPKGWMLVPPPLLFALPLIRGLFLHGRFPLVYVSTPVAEPLRWLGIILTLVGVASGCDWFVVAQDTCAGDPFDAVRQSYDYIAAHLCG